MTKRALGAQISHMLKARGVDVVFGIPGVHNQEMYRGIEEAGITHVLARHEQGAGFMADGYARASGRPGVAYVITGPGLCNIMTPMGQAYSDSVPMLVISSCLDETAAIRGQLHQMRDQKAAAATVCDWSEEARTPQAAYGLIDRALTEFHTGRPRSKHIQVPISALGAPADPAPTPAEMGPGPMDEASPLRLEPFREWLRASKRPLFIFGGGAVRNLNVTLGGNQWLDMLRGMGAASFTTYAARGLIPEGFPLHFGSYLGRPASADVIASADLVIAVGTELSECDLWRDDLGHTGRMVRIDLDPEVVSDRHGADMQILGGAYGHLVSTLIEMQEAPAKTGWSMSEVTSFRAAARSEVDAERPGIVPICDALSAGLPEDTMIYSDMTQFAYVANEVWHMPKPGHWHHPTGFGTLGYALPAAIGGAMARQDKPTMAIAGDYGFQYTLQELGAAVELGLPLPILLWDNGKLKEIEDSMIGAQIAPNAVTAHNPDFGALARAYGAYATRPATLSDLLSDIHQAFKADRPTLVHMTDGMA